MEVPGGDALLDFVVHNILQRAVNHYSVFNNLRYWMRDEVRRTPRRERNKPRGLQLEHTATRGNVSPFSPELKAYLENEHGWLGGHFNQVLGALIPSLLFHELLDDVLGNQADPQRDYQRKHRG